MTTEIFTLCGSALCMELAAFTVFWPGQTLDLCHACTKRAKTVASAMGLTLDVRELAVAQPEVRK